MYALWYLHPSAKTKKTKAAALPMYKIKGSQKSRNNQVLSKLLLVHFFPDFRLHLNASIDFYVLTTTISSKYYMKYLLNIIIRL